MLFSWMGLRGRENPAVLAPYSEVTLRALQEVAQKCPPGVSCAAGWFLLEHLLRARPLLWAPWSRTLSGKQGMVTTLSTGAW